MTIQSLEEAFKVVFALSSLQLRYQMSTGNVQGLYQDVHLENAIKDSASSGAKYLELQVTGGGAPAPASTPAAAPAAAPVAAPAAKG